MKAVILAAGIASRLRPLTDRLPKCLLEIGGKSLLERTIRGLVDNGLRDIIIVTGYLQEQIISFVGKKFPEINVSFIYNEKYASTNNIYSLWLVRKQVQHSDMILLDSDILFDPELIKTVLNAPYANCLALNAHPLCEEEMKVVTDEQGQVQEISKTCDPATAAGESIGVEKISADYSQALFSELDRMIREEKLSHIFYEAAFQRLIPQGKNFHVIDTSHIFSMELDTPEDFRTASGKLPSNLL